MSPLRERGDPIKDMKIGKEHFINEIKDWLQKNGVANYNILDEDYPVFKIDVSGDVDLRFKELTSLVIFKCEDIIATFDRVNGHFLCAHNNLVSLVGAPEYVAGDFDCSNNQLKDLTWAPSETGGNFLCHNNLATLFKPESSNVKGSFKNQNGFELITSVSPARPTIVNIDSPYDIADSDFNFIRKILFGKHKTTIIEDSIQFLAHSIPIYLVSDNKFRQLKETDKNKAIVDLLGYYTRLQTPYFNNTPSIFICPELIAKHSTLNFSYRTLLSTVIIHEYAHALMDIKDSTFKCSRDTPGFFEWVEEPFANLITLGHFKAFAEEYLKEVEEFIKSSPDEYNLGKVFFDIGFNRWKEWRDNKIQICYRTDETIKWLNYVRKHSNDPDINELENIFTKMCNQITS